MKRIFGGVIAGFILLLCMALPASASVNNFRIPFYDVDYYLGADNQGRSTLKTVEKLVAEFPNFDQNHGIERAIPKRYDGHTTSLQIQSVTDDTGAPIHYTTYESGDNLVVRIGDKNSYVRGNKTYILTYNQRDVTRYFADVGRDEFYWDTNGTQWQQPFGTLVAHVHLATSIQPTFTKDAACYGGAEGSSQTCEITQDGTTVTARASNLGPGENMTVALGFTAGTFRGYEPSLWDKLFTVWLVVLGVTSLIGIGLIIWLPIRYMKISNRTKELKPIAPEYIPPASASVLTSAQIGDGTRADTTAQLIDLAVRHYVTIAQVSEKTVWKQAEYELEIIKSIDSLRIEEQDFVSAIFGAATVGTKLQTKTLKSNYSLYNKLQKNTQTLTAMIKGEYALRHKDVAASSWFTRTGFVLLVASIITVSPLILVAAVIAFICGWILQPLTDNGLALRRYLAGLKMYIEVAEKDRITMLQSSEGAEKSGVKIKGDTDKNIIKLYERVLPYAVLFGQEKEWNKQLAIYYENTGSSPNWYVGQTAFNAAIFSSAMDDFSSSMNSYGASTSSSSGGSGGGGSSGGGGGGGGGGGW